MSSQRIHTLRYAVRPRLVLKHLGLLATVLGALTAVPMLVALATQDWSMGWRLAAVVALLAGFGVPTARLAAPEHVQLNEALTVIALAFVLGSVSMMWPLASADIPLLDALFESVSGITTTGMSTLATVEDKPASFLFARAWMQWYGGLGIVVLSVGLLMRHSAASRRLAVADVTGDTLVSTTRMHAQRVLYAYLALTALGLVSIYAVTGEAWVALLHTLSAVSTGGFSPFDDSLGGFGSSSAANTIIGVAWLGAVSFPLYYSVWTHGWRPLLHDPELHALIGITLVVMMLVLGLGYWLGQLAPVDAVLLAVSAQSTTGFSTSRLVEAGPGIELVLVGSMLLGGCIGSSAGGVKMLRLVMLWRWLQLVVQRTGTPQHAVVEPRLGGKRLGYDELARALLLLVLFGLLNGASWLMFVLHDYDPVDALFEVVSASATVGLSTGISRPDLEPFLKGVLCFDMLAGRLEIIAALVTLYPGTWFGKRAQGT